MPLNKRPYFQWFDGYGDAVIEQQSDNPLLSEFLPQHTLNRRGITDLVGNVDYVGDATVVARNAKTLIWSSEGYALLAGGTLSGGTAVAAVTATAKKATGNSGSLDFSEFKSIALLYNFTSFTAGSSPSIQFELDAYDDAGTPVAYPILMPTALTAAGTGLLVWGNGIGSYTAPSGAPVTTIAAIPLLPQGRVVWTVTGSPTAAAWTAFLYGSYK